MDSTVSWIPLYTRADGITAMVVDVVSCRKCFGTAACFFRDQATLLIMVGRFLGFRAIEYRSAGECAQLELHNHDDTKLQPVMLLMVCLLYTSPSPRD